MLDHEGGQIWRVQYSSFFIARIVTTAIFCKLGFPLGLQSSVHSTPPPCSFVWHVHDVRPGFKFLMRVLRWPEAYVVLHYPFMR